MQLNSLNDVFEEQLETLQRRAAAREALPKVAGAASSTELREAFEHHLEETRGHGRRLDEVFTTLGDHSPERALRGDGGPGQGGEK